jgi:hypothetical protein
MSTQVFKRCYWQDAMSNSVKNIESSFGHGGLKMKCDRRSRESTESNMSILEMADTIESRKANQELSNLRNGFRDIPYCLVVAECGLIAAR